MKNLVAYKKYGFRIPIKILSVNYQTKFLTVKKNVFYWIVDIATNVIQLLLLSLGYFLLEC